MPYVISKACIDEVDASCIEVCPVDCIHFEEGIDRKLYIEPEECIDCGACEPACPVSAIYAEEDLPEAETVFTDIDALWFRDKAAARAKIDEISPKGTTPS